MKSENNVFAIDVELTMALHNGLQKNDLIGYFLEKGVFCAGSRPKIWTKT